MLSLENDYSEGCCPEILARLTETNLVQTTGYGLDPYCASAQEKIRAACRCPDAAVRFLAGGTQTNMVVIDAMLAPYEGVVAAATGHIASHEAGAIEASGHKVLTLPQHDGKLSAEELSAFLDENAADGNREHMVFPGMVYVSHPTEFGTLYTRAELTAISSAARAHGLPLYLDGARLGYALAAPGTDVDLPFLCEVCDVFYIGGTKVGALFGEAAVFPRGKLPSHFTTRIKQHGALLAKGRVLGVMFDTLFTGGLYERLGENAIRTAMRLRDGLIARGERFLLESPTNQQFLILENSRLRALEKQVAVSFWSRVDGDHTCVRLATSWATRDSQIDDFFRVLDAIPGAGT